MSSLQKVTLDLTEQNAVLNERSELLDNAQDAIFVLDTNARHPLLEQGCRTHVRLDPERSRSVAKSGTSSPKAANSWTRPRPRWKQTGAGVANCPSEISMARS